MGGNSPDYTLTLKIQFGLDIPSTMKVLKKARKYLFSASLLPFPPHQYIQPVMLTAQRAGLSPKRHPLRAVPEGSVLAGHAEHPGTGSTLHPSLAYRLLDSGTKELLRGMCFQPSSGEGQVAMTKAFERKRCGMEK